MNLLILSAVLALSVLEAAAILFWRPVKRISKRLTDHAHDHGYCEGLRDGYVQGHKAADDWWMGVEREIELERARRELKGE
jgi:hypothetical protein